MEPAMFNVDREGLARQRALVPLARNAASPNIKCQNPKVLVSSFLLIPSFLVCSRK